MYEDSETRKSYSGAQRGTAKSYTCTD